MVGWMVTLYTNESSNSGARDFTSGTHESTSGVQLAPDWILTTASFWKRWVQGVACLMDHQIRVDEPQRPF